MVFRGTGMEHWDCSAAKSTSHLVAIRSTPAMASPETTLLINLDAGNVMSITVWAFVGFGTPSIFQYSGHDAGCTGRIGLTVKRYCHVCGCSYV